jgi:hypothetical protein
MGDPKMAEGFLIRTPTDFERALGSDVGDYVVAPLVSPPHEIEPDFRRALDGIFDDLQYIERGDHALLASYLEGIKAPLDDLHQLGFTLFAVVTRGTLTLPDHPTLGPPVQRKIPNWSRTYYLVVPVDGLFRVGEDTKGAVHRFSPRCESAVASLAKAARDHAAIAVWFSAEAVRAFLERSVPWCQSCCWDLAIQA